MGGGEAGPAGPPPAGAGSLPSTVEWLAGAGWMAACGCVVLVSVGILYVEDMLTLFWLGTLVNVVLSIVKMALAQVSTHQKALMADAVHGLGDTVAEVITALAYTEAAKPPDTEHPWGHGKIESIGAVLVACILLYIAATMGWDSLSSVAPMLLRHLRGRWAAGREQEPAPAAVGPAAEGPEGQKGSSRLARRAAIGVTLASMLLKEALFKATLSVAERARSNLVVATAWHHRSDSLAAGVALVSQLGTALGQDYLDLLGGGVVASMLAHSAYGSLSESLNDLLDYNPASESNNWTRCGRNSLSESIGGVQGVRNHTLRTRRMGPYCLVDATIVVDARISASAASMIAEGVHDRVIEDFRPFVTDVLVHVDPDGSPQSHRMQTHLEPQPLGQSIVSPEEIEAKVRAVLLALSDVRPELPRIVEVTELQTYYYEDNAVPEDPGAMAPYVDVKVDFRLASDDVTVRSATAVARAARERVLAALPGVVRDIDMDLELSEEEEANEGGQESAACRSAEVPETTVKGAAPAPDDPASACRAPLSLAAGKSHGSWAAEPCPAASGAPSAKAVVTARSLQQVTLIWERGPESRQARVPAFRHDHRIAWMSRRGRPGAPEPRNQSRRPPAPRRQTIVPNEPD